MSTTGVVFPYPERDWSVDAHLVKSEDGWTRAYGIVRYGRNAATTESPRLVDVTCLRISGNRAVVGGVTRGSSPAEGFVIFFVDTGPPGGPKDQASYANVEALDPALWLPDFPGWPRGFPYVCPSLTSGPGIDAYGAGFFDVDAGDVIVSGGGA